MASVDKVKIGDTSYDISPGANGTLNGYTSSDASSSTSWTSVNAITSTETNSSIFSKLTKMVKNIRYLYYKIGTTSFSSTGYSTITGALSGLQANKVSTSDASNHSHTASQLPISSTQVNSDSYIPTSKLIYSMNTTLSSLNDAYNQSNGAEIKYVDTTTGILATDVMKLGEIIGLRFINPSFKDTQYAAPVLAYINNTGFVFAVLFSGNGISYSSSITYPIRVYYYTT